MTALLTIVACLLLVFFLFEPLVSEKPHRPRVDALAFESAVGKDLRREEAVQSLTELEVDYRDKRISEIDYHAAKREVLERHVQ